jgi:hypothetical protein
MAEAVLMMTGVRTMAISTAEKLRARKYSAAVYAKTRQPSLVDLPDARGICEVSSRMARLPCRASVAPRCVVC